VAKGVSGESFSAVKGVDKKALVLGVELALPSLAGALRAVRGGFKVGF
jgi:hypothetical protein